MNSKLRNLESSSNEILKYTDFETYFDEYDEKNDYTMCLTDKCNGVEIADTIIKDKNFDEFKKDVIEMCINKAEIYESDIDNLCMECHNPDCDDCNE